MSWNPIKKLDERLCIEAARLKEKIGDDDKYDKIVTLSSGFSNKNKLNEYWSSYYIIPIGFAEITEDISIGGEIVREGSWGFLVPITFYALTSIDFNRKFTKEYFNRKSENGVRNRTLPEVICEKSRLIDFAIGIYFFASPTLSQYSDFFTSSPIADTIAGSLMFLLGASKYLKSPNDNGLKEMKKRKQEKGLEEALGA